MNAQSTQRHQPPNDGLHPLVYRTVIGLTIWFVVSAWVFFNRGGYIGLTLTVVTLFFVIAVGIPLLIWLTWRRNASGGQSTVAETFPDWAAREFGTWTGKLSGREATLQILLPIAAVAIGMTVFGLVFYFDVPGLS